MKPVVPTTAWMPCSAANARLLAGRLEVGEVDDDLGAGVDERGGVGGDVQVAVDAGGVTEVETGVQRVDRGDELELGVAEDGLAHGGAHAACRAEHPDLDHRPRL